jgi:thioredoxin reductase (NADPH)
VHPETLETNVPGVYLAGVVVAGNRTNEIFIENGRFHGREIALDLKRKLSGGQIPTLERAVKRPAGKLQSAE